MLGLSYEDFCQCVVLPQGQFANFLHAKPERTAGDPAAPARRRALPADDGAREPAGRGRRAAGRDARRDPATLADATPEAEQAARAAERRWPRWASGWRQPGRSPRRPGPELAAAQDRANRLETERSPWRQCAFPAAWPSLTRTWRPRGPRAGRPAAAEQQAQEDDRAARAELAARPATARAGPGPRAPPGAGAAGRPAAAAGGGRWPAAPGGRPRPRRGGRRRGRPGEAAPAERRGRPRQRRRRPAGPRPGR